MTNKWTPGLKCNYFFRTFPKISSELALLYFLSGIAHTIIAELFICFFSSSNQTVSPELMVKGSFKMYAESFPLKLLEFFQELYFSEFILKSLQHSYFCIVFHKLHMKLLRSSSLVFSFFLSMNCFFQDFSKNLFSTRTLVFSIHFFFQSVYQHSVFSKWMQKAFP